MFQPSRKNPKPRPNSFAAISITNTPSTSVSNVPRASPNLPMTVGDVSRPSEMALRMIKTVMNLWARLPSMNSTTRSLVVMSYRPSP